MSLTATLLLGESVTLPRGKKRTHLMDARRVQAGGQANDDRYAKNKAIRAANVDRILAAICSGIDTRIGIVAATGIGLTTTHFILAELVEHGRVMAKRGARGAMSYWIEGVE